jgi:threonine/homoserine/homoserine lactone efflux protein
MEHLLKGLGIGFAIAAPIGPINLLCLRRSLTEGRRVGFVSGLGAAAADTTYAALAAVGVTTVISFVLGHSVWLHLFGGLFLVVLGVLTMRAQPPPRATVAPIRVGRFRGVFFSTYLLTLTNPMVLIAFTGAFAAFGLDWQSSRALDVLELIGGVFVGSSLWWLTLTMLAGTFRHHLDDGRLRWINRIAGAVMAGCGVWQLWLAVATRLSPA